MTKLAAPSPEEGILAKRLQPGWTVTDYRVRFDDGSATPIVVLVTGWIVKEYPVDPEDSVPEKLLLSLNAAGAMKLAAALASAGQKVYQASIAEGTSR
ncbi:MAG: hypothetical protein QOJ11_4477 [Frankiales bacterium]|jgi:hypothetical protein|nr:hypothetical protein [Frankiales bacterium]